MTDASPAPALHWQKAAIESVAPHTPRVTSFFLKLAQPFAFLPGQHVDVRLTAPDGYQAQRSYSIASAPAASDSEPAEHIELSVELLDDGEVSPWFHDVATVGDEVELRGPIGGHFVWSEADGGPVLLVGGGSGIVPLISMIRHRAARRSRTRMSLLFSARTWDDLIFRDELLDLRDDGFEPIFTLTREAARRAGDYARRVDAAMMSEVAQRLGDPPKLVFVCGSNSFVETAAQGLIAANIPTAIIRTERYGS